MVWMLIAVAVVVFMLLVIAKKKGAPTATEEIEPGSFFPSNFPARREIVAI